MNTARWLGLAAVLALAPQAAHANGWRKDLTVLDRVNAQLKGRVIDHTANHGCDRRIWSRVLYQRRDLYVYLPPGFDECQHYPLMIWLHGFTQDEQDFLTFVAPLIDHAIACGKLPPLIIAAPDGSIHGEPSCASLGSFFINSQAGAFEDFVLQDVWDFVVGHYPIRSEREAHILAGVSMGGFAAFNFGIKHKDAFGVVMGLYPPLNLRWVDDKGRYFSDFNPYHWGWRTDLDRGHESVGRFVGGMVNVRMRRVIDPLFGRGPEALVEVARENPIEMLERYQICDGDLQMYIAYGGRDQFNIDAQVESFLYVCKHRGITVGVGYEPDGRHDTHTAYKLAPGMIRWLAPLIAPYAPCQGGECCDPCDPCR